MLNNSIIPPVGECLQITPLVYLFYKIFINTKHVIISEKNGTTFSPPSSAFMGPPGADAAFLKRMLSLCFSYRVGYASEEPMS